MLNASLKNKPRFWLNPLLLACTTFIICVAGSIKIASIEADSQLNIARSLATHDLATIRARLEGTVNSVFSATSGLVHVTAHQGEITQELFNSLAAEAIKIHPQIRNIAVAPNNTISMVYPLAGNEQVVGLNYHSLPDQYRTIEQAIKSGHPVLDGPRKLVQGGTGLILRSPVFIDRQTTSGRTPRYWGMVSIVANVDAILDSSGIQAPKGLLIGLRRTDNGSGNAGALIWGEASVFDSHPVSLSIAVPGGEWQIAAVRSGGWPSLAPSASPIFYAGVLNSLLLAILVWGLSSRHRRVRKENIQLTKEIQERERTAEQLRLSQQKYLHIFNLMPDMVGITRLSDGLLIEVNAGFEQWTGWRTDEAVGRTSLDLELWDAETRSAAIARLKENGQLVNFEFVMKTKSGEKRNALMYLTTIQVDGEECLYFMAHDITALKQAQVILENERSRLQILLQTIPALVWMKDPAGKYLACNSRFERFFGASRENILGKTDYDFVDSELADFFREHDRIAIAAGRPTVNEEWITYADDSHRELLETTKAPVYDAQGGVMGVLGIARDITENRRIEEELRNERQRFKTLVDSVDGIVWELDIETFTFTYVSSQAERLLGYPVEAWSQSGFWIDHLHPDDREWAATFCADSTARHEDHEFEYRFIAQDGRTVWLHDIVTVVVEEGRPRWLRGIMVDTTEAKKKESENLKLEAQLRQAQKMEAIGRLAGGVAHDFNNKLAVILGYAEMAQRGGTASDRYQDYLERVIAAANQSRDITRQLLAFSRQEVIAPRVLNLNDLVRDAQKGFCRFIGEDIQLEIKLADQLWPINLDPSQVDQIIMNLVVNARDAMPDGGILLIETGNALVEPAMLRSNSDAAPGEYVRLTVNDTGCGMDQEIVQHIFEPFFTTKETGKGTGLGLATIYGIITQNSGFVEVYSEPGIGTTFRIYFPRSYEAKNPANIVDQEVRPGRPASVLLVEDDESVRNMITDILTVIGYTVQEAATPQEAIQLCTAKELTFDLLLSDIIMPGMNGRELAERIKEVCPDVKILFMSGYTAEIIDQKGILHEGTNFISKPFDRATLHNKIQSIIHSEIS